MIVQANAAARAAAHLRSFVPRGYGVDRHRVLSHECATAPGALGSWDWFAHLARSTLHVDSAAMVYRCAELLGCPEVLAAPAPQAAE